MTEKQVEYCPDCGGEGEFCPTVKKPRRYICQRCNGDGLMHPSIKEQVAELEAHAESETKWAKEYHDNWQATLPVVKAAIAYVHTHADVPHFFEQLENAVRDYEQATKRG